MRVVEELPGEIRVGEQAGPDLGEAAGSLQPRTGREAEEREVRPRPRQDLVGGDLDLFVQDLQLPIVAQGLLDQGQEHPIVVKLFDPDLG